MESWILIILVIMPGVWSGYWGVTFEDRCALKGTSVVIKCSYDYPYNHEVKAVGWSKIYHVSGQRRLFYLSQLPSPQGHFNYVGDFHHNCNLKINNVQDSDEGENHFSFRTTWDTWTSKTSAHLSVKELTAVVQPSSVREGESVSLTCVSGCPTPTTIVWFRDGQPVPTPGFQARSEDAGRYHCAVLGQEAARSASVALNVQYAPKRVTLSVNPSEDAIKGSSVTLTCSSDANPPVTQSGYSLYKDGQFISSGQNHTISDIQPSHSGLYQCQAWNNISWGGAELMNSTEVHLDVQYLPVNMSVSMDPPQVAEGSSVNLTCSSVANPAVDNYTWYKKTADSPSSSVPLQVGSGRVLSLPSVEASHTGLYFCRARNSVGENYSAELLLAMERKEHGTQALPLIGVAGVFLIVTLVIAVLLFWRKRRTHAEKKQTMLDSVFSAADEDCQSDTVYANIHAFSSSPSAAAHNAASDSQRSSHHEHEALASYEDEVTYSTVTIKPRNPSLPHHVNNSRAQDSCPKTGESDDSVIYATVAKSS